MEASRPQSTPAPRSPLADSAYLVSVGFLAIVYFGTARLGLHMDAVSGFATTVWPPTGIALVALCLFGYRLWPGIALGAFLTNLSAGAPILAACGMAMGNTLEALLGTYLLIRFTGFKGSLDRISHVIGLVVLAAGVSTMVSATIGVASGYLGGVIARETLGKAWLTWWLGDAMGDLILAPVLFTWASLPRINMPYRRLAEAVALLGAVIGISLVGFGAPSPIRAFANVEPYMIFPFLVYAALRFGQHGTVTATFAVACVAILTTARGQGPFVAASVNDSLLSLQAFMSIVAVTMLVLGANITERRLVESELRSTQEDLEKRVVRRTSQLSDAVLALEDEVGERKQAEKSLQDLSARLLKVQDEERQRLSRELHDSTAQNLAALSMNLSVVMKHRESMDASARTALEESVTLAGLSSSEIRSISYLLHPPQLEVIGLTAALRWLAEGFAKRSGISVDLDLPPEGERLAIEVEKALYRIVQECLTNVHRHSGSARARIRLARNHHRVLLEVQDEGRGIRKEILSRTGVEFLGVGILGMRERVRQLGGILVIDSGAGGAAVRVEIPVGTESA